MTNSSEHPVIDSLTGIANLHGFKLMSEQALKMCERMSTAVSLVMFDLDDFSVLNEQCGTEAGDDALRAFAHILQQQFRGSDVFARVGDDEFAALLTGTGEDNVQDALNRVHAAVNQLNENREPQQQLFFSTGYTVRHKDENKNMESMLNTAISRMHENKLQKDIV